MWWSPSEQEGIYGKDLPKMKVMVGKTVRGGQKIFQKHTQVLTAAKSSCSA